MTIASWSVCDHKTLPCDIVSMELMTIACRPSSDFGNVWTFPDPKVWWIYLQVADQYSNDEILFLRPLLTVEGNVVLLSNVLLSWCGEDPQLPARLPRCCLLEYELYRLVLLAPLRAISNVLPPLLQRLLPWLLLQQWMCRWSKQQTGMLWIRMISGVLVWFVGGLT